MFKQEPNSKKYKIIILLFFGLFCSLSVLHAEQFLYIARITDTQGNEFLIQNINRDEFEYFNCRIRNDIFELNFSEIQSITFTGIPNETLTGYTLATVVLVNNHSANLYIRSGNNSVAGFESNFNIEIKIPIHDIQSITFIQEVDIQG